jgi:hypothetical protein
MKYLWVSLISSRLKKTDNKKLAERRLRLGQAKPSLMQKHFERIIYIHMAKMTIMNTV